MTFCSNCGAPLQENVPFCSSCGTRVVPPAPPPGYIPPAPPGYIPPAPPGYIPPAPPGYIPPVQGSPLGGQVAMQMMYAPWSTRVLGYLIDSFLVGGCMLVLYLILGSMLATMAHLGGDYNVAGGMCCMMILLFPAATLLVGLFNRVYLVASRGYSIGQGVVHVKVVDGNGNLLTTGTAFIRLLAQAAMGFVPILPLLDLLWPLWDERRQTLHDKAVGSYVIHNP